jgi:hypothetical protein
MQTTESFVKLIAQFLPKRLETCASYAQSLFWQVRLLFFEIAAACEIKALPLPISIPRGLNGETKS